MPKFNIGDKVWLVVQTDRNLQFDKGRYPGVVKSIDDPEVLLGLAMEYPQHFAYALTHGPLYVLDREGESDNTHALEYQLEAREEEKLNA